MIKLSEYLITSELSKIAFILRHADFFDDFLPRQKNILMNLPIIWKNITVDGKHQDRGMSLVNVWKKAVLEGELEGIPITLTILRVSTYSDKHYIINYKDKEYKVAKLSDLQALVKNLQENVETRADVVFKVISLTKDPSFKNSFANKIRQNLAIVTSDSWKVFYHYIAIRHVMDFILELPISSDASKKEAILQDFEKFKKEEGLSKLEGILKEVLEEYKVDSSRLNIHTIAKILPNKIVLKMSVK